MPFFGQIYNIFHISWKRKERTARQAQRGWWQLTYSRTCIPSVINHRPTTLLMNLLPAFCGKHFPTQANVPAHTQRQSHSQMFSQQLPIFGSLVSTLHTDLPVLVSEGTSSLALTDCVIMSKMLSACFTRCL